MPRGSWLAVLLSVGLAGAAWHFRDELRMRLVPGPTFTPIASIVAAPARYDGKEVTVKGVVSSTSEIRLSGGAAHLSYSLKEDGAELVVVAREAVPPRGHPYTVTGTISRPPGRGLAPRLAETRRERTPPVARSPWLGSRE
jgi:hypothetical protein